MSWISAWSLFTHASRMPLCSSAEWHGRRWWQPCNCLHGLHQGPVSPWDLSLLSSPASPTGTDQDIAATSYCKLKGFRSCIAVNGWLGGVVVSMLDSRPRGPGFNSQPVHCQAMTLGKLLTPMCLCYQAVQFGTGQRAVMLCGWEGNRRSGVALAKRHRL